MQSAPPRGKQQARLHASGQVCSVLLELPFNFTFAIVQKIHVLCWAPDFVVVDARELRQPLLTERGVPPLTSPHLFLLEEAASSLYE